MRRCGCFCVSLCSAKFGSFCFTLTRGHPTQKRQKYPTKWRLKFRKIGAGKVCIAIWGGVMPPGGRRSVARAEGGPSAACAASEHQRLPAECFRHFDEKPRRTAYNFQYFPVGRLRPKKETPGCVCRGSKILSAPFLLLLLETHPCKLEIISKFFQLVSPPIPKRITGSYAKRRRKISNVLGEDPLSVLHPVYQAPAGATHAFLHHPNLPPHHLPG